MLGLVLIALVPAVENAVAEDAMRPGDILKSLSGKTIEILHTDAEGRVILADAITYAKRYNPALVADVATLTGAALVAHTRHMTVADAGHALWNSAVWRTSSGTSSSAIC